MLLEVNLKVRSFLLVDSIWVLVYYTTSTQIHIAAGGEKMNFESNLPIYIQIMNLIKTKIVSGELKRGDKLPSVRELSKELKVNPNTIQRAYQELEREEFVYTQRGMGTFVTENTDTIQNVKKSMATGLIDQFFSEMKNLGFKNDEIKEMVSHWLAKEE